MRRRDERGIMRLSSSRALRGPAERAALEQSAVFLSDVRSAAHYGLKSDIRAESEKCQ